MASFSEQMSQMAPWRRVATIVLLLAAVAVFVLAVTGVIHGAGVVVAVVIVGLSLLVGPRSPFFGSGAS